MVEDKCINGEPDKDNRILFLGGFPQMEDVVNKAKEMGIYTIVVDMDPHSPAKKIADKSYDISTNEIDTLADVCIAENITGIFNGFEDFNIHIARVLCEKMSLPFYANNRQLEIVTVKDKFKQECLKHDIEVIKQFTLEEAIESKQFPYIIKPVDSYGSRGISICHTEEELISGKLKAEQSSKTNRVIIEQFIDSNVGTELFYTVINSHIHLTATADRYTYKIDDTSVPLPVAEIFPSDSDEKKIMEIDLKFRELLSDLNIKNGLVLIQMLNQNGKFYPYEMAYRLTGEQHYQLVEEQQGIDLAKMMIKLSINEDVSEYDTEKIDLKYFNRPAANLAILLKPGKIEQIKGLDELKNIKEIKSMIVTHAEKEYVENRGDYSRILLRANIVADDHESLTKVMRTIKDRIFVISDKNENMVLKSNCIKFI